MRINFLCGGSRWTAEFSCSPGSAPALERVDQAAPADPSMASPGLGGMVRAAAAPARRQADAESVALRQAACTACSQNDLGRCRRCSCYLWPKVRVAEESCPDGLWGPCP